MTSLCCKITDAFQLTSTFGGSLKRKIQEYAHKERLIPYPYILFQNVLRTYAWVKKFLSILLIQTNRFQMFQLEQT